MTLLSVWTFLTVLYSLVNCSSQGELTRIYISEVGISSDSMTLTRQDATNHFLSLLQWCTLCLFLVCIKFCLKKKIIFLNKISYLHFKQLGPSASLSFLYLSLIVCFLVNCAVHNFFLQKNLFLKEANLW